MTTASALAVVISMVLAAAAGAARADAGYDRIAMHQQVKEQWCWAASGLTIAKFQGYGSTQDDFCKRAAKYDRYLSCDNRPATLDDMAYAWHDLGMTRPGQGLVRAASFAEITSEVKASRPVAARIGWTSGGGHMNVIYGFNTANNTIAVADPWPATKTYTWWNYNDYVSNRAFRWTHSRIGISK
ncbi:papain-like cysteine protease family protein [Kitasatospora mediocidica]|uniref:papain-like cysteine protease family protein n=1 Tax=Kitasatospora mediocidica TaxID=58352 RepID=UPI001E61A678|nr:papain-like cysteine protease family protein [Kitasatospora mediocidica]